MEFESDAFEANEISSDLKINQMKVRAKLTLNQKENEDIPSESNAIGRE
jgi:hypothetical protein